MTINKNTSAWLHPAKSVGCATVVPGPGTPCTSPDRHFKQACLRIPLSIIPINAKLLLLCTARCCTALHAAVQQRGSHLSHLQHSSSKSTGCQSCCSPTTITAANTCQWHPVISAPLTDAAAVCRQACGPLQHSLQRHAAAVTCDSAVQSTTAQPAAATASAAAAAAAAAAHTLSLRQRQTSLARCAVCVLLLFISIQHSLLATAAAATAAQTLMVRSP